MLLYVAKSQGDFQLKFNSTISNWIQSTTQVGSPSIAVSYDIQKIIDDFYFA